MQNYLIIPDQNGNKQYYDKDYRKASEVAKQIFAEIEEIFGVHLWLNATPNEYEDYKELKKKYTESEKDDGTDGISS